jgi:VCBS repeat-containing protein
MHKRLVGIIIVISVLLLLGAVPVFALSIVTNGRIFYNYHDPDLGINTRIHSVNPSGQDTQIIVQNDGTFNYEYSTISPDGKKIAYVEHNNITYENSIAISNADGTNQQIIISIGNDHINALAWSPDESKLVYNDYTNIVTVNIADSSDEVIPVNLSDEIHSISWSVDNVLAVEMDDYVYTFNLNGSNLQNLTAEDPLINAHLQSIAWSPDGKKLVFTVDSSVGNNSQITIMNADGSNKSIVVNRAEHTDDGCDLLPNDTKWSPDGNKLVFSKQRNCGAL